MVQVGRRSNNGGEKETWWNCRRQPLDLLAARLVIEGVCVCVCGLLERIAKDVK